MHRWGGLSRAVLVVVSLSAVTAVACTLLVPLGDVQCNSSSDCPARGPAFAGAVCVNAVCVSPEGGASGDAGAAEGGGALPASWACLDQASSPSDPSLSVDVEFITFDSFQPYTLGSAIDGGNDLTILQYSATPGVTIEACSALDPLCVMPATPQAVTDDAGIAHLALPGSFGGLYFLQHPGDLPSLYYPGRLLAGQPTVTYPTSLVPVTEIAELGTALGINANTDPDAGLGHVFVTASDCNDRNAAGVSFSLVNADAGGSSYLQNGLPNPKGTETDKSGVGGFINIPGGSVSISAQLVAYGRSLGTFNVFVRPATMTLVLVRARTR